MLPKPSPLDVVVGDEPSEVEPVELAEELEGPPSPTLPEPSPLDVVGDELSGVELVEPVREFKA
jgi:hypothetical protein